MKAYQTTIHQNCDKAPSGKYQTEQGSIQNIWQKTHHYSGTHLTDSMA